MDSKSFIGRVVISKAGRDADRKFIIVDVINHQYVNICDGDLRKIENPKKKKIKHLNLTNTFAGEITQLLANGDKVSNSKIKKFLQSIDDNEEV
ncbi:KOW domain-containing RNA-binding protein [Clostridium sp. KNHs214]|uniref:KOW domain-containing RNA-binding protein n=1 Tax=Clostridium sp. KNHs214 TaxID=1540257 RepID=UPI00055726FA|nr:KOW domain-containing RNA-binding protein [Clostridium sp. KNHs214]